MAGHKNGHEARLRNSSWRVAVAAAMVAGGLLIAPVPATEAHTCTPDASVGVSGRLVVPRASGVAVVELPGRATRSVPISPSQGVTTAVAASSDGSMLAVPRFWRPPADRVGGQDIMLVRQDGGEPVGTLTRSQPGEVLGSPAWLPDGSLIYERRVLSGTNEAVRIERAHPGQPAQVLAEGAYSPSVSPDGSLMAMVRFAGTERLSVLPVAGGAERVLVDRPQLLSIAFPRFSPDGAWIAFSAAADPAVADQQRDRQTASWRLPLLGAANALFRVGTASAHGVPWDIWVVRPDGSDLRQVTWFSDDDSSVAWSPDGRHLATYSAEAIHVVSFDGAETYCVTAEGGYGGIEWLP